MEADEGKQKKMMRWLFAIAAVCGFFLPFVIVSIADSGDINRIHIAVFSWPIILLAWHVGAQEQGRIRKWFLLTITWNLFCTVGITASCVIREIDITFLVLVSGFLVGFMINFLVGLGIGWIGWRFAK